MEFKIEVVWPDGDPEKRKAIFKLRYEAYVIDHGFSFPDIKDGLLKEVHDDIHPSLLFTDGDLPIGTFRVELSDLGEMDIRLQKWTIPKSGTASFSRYAVAKAYRGKFHFLRAKGFYIAMFEVIAKFKLPVTDLYLCTNQPGLIRLYRIFCVPVDLEPKPYSFPGGVSHEGYTLWKASIGKPWSLKRLKSRAYIGLLTKLMPLALKISRMISIPKK